MLCPYLLISINELLISIISFNDINKYGLNVKTAAHNCVSLCLSDETLKAVGPFYLVYMPGEVKYPTSLHWRYVTCR